MITSNLQANLGLMVVCRPGLWIMCSPDRIICLAWAPSPAAEISELVRVSVGVCTGGDGTYDTRAILTNLFPLMIIHRVHHHIDLSSYHLPYHEADG